MVQYDELNLLTLSREYINAALETWHRECGGNREVLNVQFERSSPGKGRLIIFYRELETNA